MSWKVYLEVDSELKPRELEIMVNMFPGVNDARVMDKATEVIAETTPKESE